LTARGNQKFCQTDGLIFQKLTLNHDRKAEGPEKMQKKQKKEKSGLENFKSCGILLIQIFY
jgi:hypothetical protein